MSFTNPYPASRLTLDATNSLSSGLVGFWPLTDGGGTTAKDITTNANDGTESGTVSWVSTDIGAAASFDGVDDRFDLTSIGSMDFSSSDFTVSMWIYVDSISSPEYLWVKQTSGNSPSCIFWFYNSTTLQLIHLASTAGCTTDYTIASSLVGGWNHLVASVSSPSSLLASNHAVYLNGELLTPNASVNGSGTITASSGTLSLAGRISDNLRQLSGDYQNVRVYNRALSATEVATLYNRPWEGTNYGDLWPYSPPVPSSATLSTDTAATSLMSGCVGWWPLTEGTGTIAKDVTSNANDGTQSGSVSWAIAPLGNTASFDGTDDRFDVSGISTDFDSSDFSVSLWVNLHDTSDNQYFYVREGTGGPAYIFWITAGVVRVFNGTGGIYTRSDYNIVSSLLDTWTHFVVRVSGNKLLSSSISLYRDGTLLTPSSTANGTTSLLDGSGTFVIGGRTTDNLRNVDADIQNVRIWNRALTADEITLLAERPWEGLTYGDEFHYDPPTPANLTPLDNSSGINTDQELWLPLTDGTGATAVDISGNGNDGTLSTTNLWSDQRIGGCFDGSTLKHISGTGTHLGSSSGTLSMWFKADSERVNQYMLSLPYTSASSNGFDIAAIAGGCRVDLFTSAGFKQMSYTAQNVQDGDIYHIVATYDGSGIYLYVDGVQVSTTTHTGTINQQVDGEFNVNRFGSYGRPSDGYYHNVRIWSRALSAAEVWSIYENPWLGSAYSDAAAVVYQYILRSKRFRRL